jgi:hypothetical protein
MIHLTKRGFFSLFRSKRPRHVYVPGPGRLFYTWSTSHLKEYALWSNPKLSTAIVFCTILPLLFTSCGPTVSRPPTQPKITIDSSFQGQTPPPHVPTYRCGAWSSNNAPGPYSTIIIYAKLTQNVTGVDGAVATATAHFNGTDVALTQQPVSDSGGYVMFLLPLQGRQPDGVPTTVDVSFHVDGQTVPCTPAFFTPW